MTPDDYLREIAQILTRQEDLNDQEVRDAIYELALRIYALLLQRLPEGRFERYMRWPELRAQIVLWLLELNDLLAQAYYSRLIITETAVLAPTAKYLQIPEGVLKPRPIGLLLEEVQVVGVPVARLFSRNRTTGISPFVTQMLQLLERTVVGSFFSDPTTKEIARKVVERRVVAGKERPRVTKGSVANGWRERVRSMTAAALWGTVTPAAVRGVQLLATEGVITRFRWRWNAVLDPKTCPVCRPLHGLVVDQPSQLPNGPPPLHPRCRCVLIPVMG